MKATKIYQQLSEADRVMFDEWVDKADFASVGELTTVCLLHLDNGFEIVGSSSCSDATMYNETLGKTQALLNALDLLQKHISFLAQETGEKDIIIKPE